MSRVAGGRVEHHGGGCRSGQRQQGAEVRIAPRLGFGGIDRAAAPQLGKRREPRDDVGALVRLRRRGHRHALKARPGQGDERCPGLGVGPRARGRPQIGQGEDPLVHGDRQIAVPGAFMDQTQIGEGLGAAGIGGERCFEEALGGGDVPGVEGFVGGAEKPRLGCFGVRFRRTQGVLQAKQGQPRILRQHGRAGEQENGKGKATSPRARMAKPAGDRTRHSGVA